MHTSTTPSIASPDGNINSLPFASMARNHWNRAPYVVGNWAYAWNWLCIIILLQLVVICTVGLSPVDSYKTGPDPLAASLLLLLLVFTVCLNHGLKKGVRWAWGGQMAFSCLGLLAFPLGTAIYGFLLSQWFKPETKAWFGQS